MGRPPALGIALALISATVVNSRLGHAQGSADDEDEPDRLPLEALALMDTAAVQEQLELQASLFPRFHQWASEQKRSFGLGVGLEIGLLDGLELGAGLALEHAWSQPGATTGLSNWEIEIIGQILCTGMFRLSGGLGVEGPATDEMLGDRDWGLEPEITADARAGIVHMGLSFAWELELDDEEVEHIPVVAAALYAALGRWVPVLETRAAFGDQADARAALGLFVNASEQWEFGLSGLVGLTDTAPDFGIVGVVTWEAELKEERDEQ